MHSEPNYSLPWQRKRQFSSTSSGFVISGRRILTNAHSVDHHTQASPCMRTSLCESHTAKCAGPAPATSPDGIAATALSLTREVHVQVKVRRRGSDTKFVAAVLAVGTECDIGMCSAFTLRLSLLSLCVSGKGMSCLQPNEC